MRATRRQLRQILTTVLRESALLETPLDGYVQMPRRPYLGREYPSVGYNIPQTRGKTEAESFEDFETTAKVLMSDTEDNFIIVTKPHVGYTNIEEEILAEISRRGIKMTPNTRILVVESTPFNDDYVVDYDTPDWVVAHDIIGHSIENFFMEKYYNDLNLQVKKPKYLSDLKFMFYGIIKEIAPALHLTAISPEMRMSKNNKEDMLPDIFSAILLKKFDIVAVSRVIQNYMSQKYPGGKEITPDYEREINFKDLDVLDMLLEVPSEWVKSLRPGINTVIPF